MAKFTITNGYLLYKILNYCEFHYFGNALDFISLLDQIRSQRLEGSSIFINLSVDHLFDLIYDQKRLMEENRTC